MRRSVLFILLLSLILTFAFGCGKKVTTLAGVVKDEDGNPLQGITVSLDGQTATTDENGKYVFKNLEEGSYKLSVSVKDFYPFEVNVKVKSGENTRNIGLKHTTLAKARKRGYLLVGSEVAYAPFEFMQDGNPTGFDIDLIKEISKEMGLSEPKIIDTAWDGIFAALKAEKFDIIISAVTITEDRSKEMLFSDPYYDSGQIIAVRKDNNEIKNEDDLVGKVVGVQINTTGDFAAQKIKGIKEIRRYDDIQQAFQDLEIGRIDAVINDLPVSAYYASTRPDIKLVGKLLTIEHYGIAARLGDNDLIEEINKALKKIKESGKYRELYVKWFGVEPPQ